jgi:hypothetical protein
MGFLTSLPSVRTGVPQPITINGRTGQWVDLELDPAWTKSCPWSDGSPAAPLVYANTGVTGAVGTGKHREFFIDIGHGDTVNVEINGEDPARWDALIAEAMPIVESFVFAEPGTTP